MKRVWWGALVVLLCGMTPLQTMALATAPSPSVANKVNGPLLITGYSFSGRSLRYAQIYNASNDVVRVDGWKVAAEYGTSQQVYATLSGSLAPGKYLAVANVTSVPSATITYVDTVAPSDPILASISLLPPADLNLNNEVATPTVVTSTVRVAGTPATFYFSRNISTTTGNYLTTFTPFIPSANFTLTSDPLYVAPTQPALEVAEIYPDAPVCSPFDTAATCSDYVKVFNASNAAIDLSTFRIRTGNNSQAASTTNNVVMNGMLQGGEYASFPLSLSASGSWVWLEDRYGIVQYTTTVVNYPSSANYDAQAWSYDESTGTWRWTALARPGNQPNQFPVPTIANFCSGLILNEIAANTATEDQFIEIVNTAQSTIDITGCMIQTNRSATASYAFQGSLKSGEFKTVYVKDTNLTLTKTTSGTVFLLSSDGLTEVSQAPYDSLSENSSWALLGNDWKQTFSQTPNALNIWTEYLPCVVGYSRNTETGLCNKLTTNTNITSMADCGEGKYRSPDTNRCRAIEATVTSATCDPGQYRNSETNRCRSIVSSGSLLSPCASNQERNPETNRCKVIASATTLAPCAKNQERNPDTNRCRNKKNTSTKTDFPVEVVAQTGEATLGWWAFGGVGTLAVGYAGWEWRREIAGAIKKVGLFVAGRP